MNEPTRAKKLPVTPSAPLMEKAYCPLRLALEKLPVGVGGAGTAPPPPQAAVNAATHNAMISAKRFIAHRPSDYSAHWQGVLCRSEHQPEREAIRDQTERQQV